MARITLRLDSATADEARAFILAFQTTGEYDLPRQVSIDPTVQIMGAGWHVHTPAMTQERAVAMVARLTGQ